MKIGFVFYNLSKCIGGVQRAGTYLVNAMQRRGHECVVFIVDHKRRPPVFSLDEGVAVEYIDLLDNSWSRERIRQQIVEISPDLLIPMTSSNDLRAWFVILHGTDIPLVVSERSDPVAAQSSFSSPAERYGILSSAACIHVQTRAGRDSYPEYLKDRVSVIPNPCMPAAMQRNFSSNNSKEMKRIVHVGRIHDEPKQQRLLVKAFALLASEFNDWELHFWGDGSETEERLLKETIQEYALEKQVFMKGVTSDVPGKLLGAEVFVFPSKYEGFPNALAEALAHGVPAVGYRQCGGTNALIEEGVNGLLFDELTPESLAGKMRLLLADSALRKQMGQAAVAVSKQYEPEHVFDQFDEFFRSVPYTSVEDTAEGGPKHVRNSVKHLLDSEYLYKSKTPSVRPLLVSMVEDARKRLSRDWIRPVRDFIRKWKKRW